MVKVKKNNLHLEVLNDVDLEFETASTTSRQRKIKGETSAKTKNSSLMKQKAKPKKSGSFLIINGKEIPLDNKSKLNKRTVLKKNALKKPKRTLKIKNPKASSTLKKRPVSSKSTKRIVLEKSALKTPKRSLKMKMKSPKASSTLRKKPITSKSTKRMTLEKSARITKRGSSKRKMTSSKVPSLKSKKLMPFIIIKGKKIPIKSIPKKSMKSKTAAPKEGKTVSMRSQPKKNSMKSKPVSLKQGKALSMRSHPGRGSASKSKSAGPLEKVKQFWNDLTSPSKKMSSDGSQMKLKINAKKEGNASKKQNRSFKTRKASAGAKNITRNSRKVSKKASQDPKGTSSRAGMAAKRSKAKKKMSSKRRSNGKKQLKPSVSDSPRKLMPFMSDKKLTFEDKTEAFQSSGTDTKNSESKTIYMPIKQEPNGQTAEAIIVEDKEKASVQNVEIVEEAEKKH